jgi:hypothetical protein
MAGVQADAPNKVSFSMLRVIRRLLPVLVFLCIAPAAGATTLGFDCITSNSATDCGIGEAQLSVEITAYGTNQVLFEFHNEGSDAASITDVYFDDGALLGIAEIINGTGVSFSQGASPGDLPGGNTVGFDATVGFTADSDPPAQPNGVNPGEELGIVFDLQAGMDFDDVLDFLNSGGLVIGIHVQGFDGGGSESFTNNNPIPEPGTLLLLTAGGIGVLARRRRRVHAI